MFRNRGFIFREIIMYTVKVECVLHASSKLSTLFYLLVCLY